jgi:glycerol kinase
MPYILSIDQSTSTTKALIFTSEGQLIDKEAVGHKQYYPQPGWVEHDADEIYTNTLVACRTLLERHPPRLKDLACLSISNQRETIVVFDRKSGQPLYHAIVWQCRRGAPFCSELIQANYSDRIQKISGLRIDTYFPASKLKWLFTHHPEIREKVHNGTALIGTIDTYLIYRLTRGRTHATDHTNASRTLLYDIGKLQWSEDLCDLFDVARSALPAPYESSAQFGETDLEGLLQREIPVCGVMGDSQAAMFAERCFDPGEGKVTFGTGSSVLVNIGDRLRFSEKGIVSTIGWVHGGKPTYAFEGIINFTGAVVSWLKDQLKLIETAQETEALASAVPDNEGVYLVPAFVGLSAPYWAPEAKGAIVGLTPASDKRHVVRAALESVAYQVRELLDLMTAEARMPLQFVRADGGMVRNRFFMQLLADLTRVPVRASALPDLSALGAALAGALGMGIHDSLAAVKGLPHDFKDYHPAMDQQTADRNYAGWKSAVQRVL